MASLQPYSLQNVLAVVELALLLGLLVDGVLPALEGHGAGAHQLQYAELAQQVLDGLGLAVVADDGQRDGAGGHVDDGGAEDVRPI